jgi:hypothetical protein
MILLKPNLEAYSNNSHKNGVLPKTLYYLTLVSLFPLLAIPVAECNQLFIQDSVDKQSKKWKEDHLPPGQLQEDPAALEAYCNAVGDLLNYQRSNLQTLVSFTPNF